MHEVTVYTLPNCVQCNQTKKQLDKNGVEYATVNLTEDEEAYRHVTEELGYKSAPVVIVRDDEGIVIDHWSGFQPEQINNLKN